jgi:predicted phage tail component-like protein
MGFSFQGIHSKEKKLKARITGYPMLPAFRNNTESIPGRSGILDFGMEYSERIIPVECSVFPEQDFSALVHRIDEINGWLNPYRGVQPLIFDEYPYRYFMARMNTEISMERVSRTAGTFSLEFICPDPFGYAVEDEVFSIAAEGKTTVNRQKGNLISEPIFELNAIMDSTSSYVDIEVKENINTLDAKGEVLLTILSSLAQDESRSISENCTWGIRRRFETGKHKMSTKRFLGYDTDENGKLVINRMQEPIVVRLYQEFLDGKTTDYIKRIFEKEGVRNWDGGTKWQATTLMSMLENEKYKGDALLQKSYTVDFLTKKRTQNKGEIQMFYVEDDHDAIISKRIWECVQLEIKRRKKYLEEHGTNSYSHRPESNPFASKIICGDCNKVFARKGWQSSTGVGRKVWQCSERYEVKGVMGCANRHVEEETLIKAYLMAWNALVENREDFMEQWTEQLQSENLLEGYRAEKFIEYTDGAEPLTEMDTDFMLKTLDHIKVFEDGTLLVVFLDRTEIECKNEEE